MTDHTVVMTTAASEDYARMEDFALDRELGSKAPDYGVIDRMASAFERSLRLLEISPFSCRRHEFDGHLRELVVPSGGSGLIVLFEIRDEVVLVLAIRHQVERDSRH